MDIVKQECCIRKMINLESARQTCNGPGLLGSSFKPFTVKVFMIKALISIGETRSW